MVEELQGGTVSAWHALLRAGPEVLTGSSDTEARAMQTSSFAGETAADKEWALAVVVRRHRSPSRPSSLLRTTHKEQEQRGPAVPGG